MTQRRFLPLILALFAPLSAACGDPAEPQLVDRISLEPDSVFVSPGEIATFSAMPISERGDRLEDRASRVQWTITSPNLSGESAEGSTFQRDQMTTLLDLAAKGVDALVAAQKDAIG